MLSVDTDKNDILDGDKMVYHLAGLFGAPLIIESDTDFEETVITFTYDEKALGEIPEGNLRIMWYDEKNDIYHLNP